MAEGYGRPQADEGTEAIRRSTKREDAAVTHVYMGIDPGLTGAVASFCLGEEPLVEDTPVGTVGSKRKQKKQYLPHEMADLICDHFIRLTGLPFSMAPRHMSVAIEAVHAMPGQGVTSTYSIGLGMGLWLGILSTLGVPYELVTPQRWKQVMMHGMQKEKEASRLRAQQLFPQLRGQLNLKKHHGRADALLIAQYSYSQDASQHPST